jgi:hypothetical protein
MEPFREATYEQIERVLIQIDRLQPVEKPGTGIPSLGFLERWIDDSLVPDQEMDDSTEKVIRMWENARPREDDLNGWWFKKVTFEDSLED